MKNKNFEKSVYELKILLADYLLAGALWLYPAGKERRSLAWFLARHFKLVLGMDDANIEDPEKDQEAI